eukprot:1153152-Amorphochlora_amoeboformis.AAC.1
MILNPNVNLRIKSWQRGSIVTRDMEREKARIEREEEDKKNSRISKNFSEVTTGEPIGEQEG